MSAREPAEEGFASLRPLERIERKSVRGAAEEGADQEGAVKRNQLDASSWFRFIAQFLSALSNCPFQHNEKIME